MSGPRDPDASATADRGEEGSIERQAKPGYGGSEGATRTSAERPSADEATSEGEGERAGGMGPGVATHVIGTSDGVGEASIPDGPGADDDDQPLEG